MHGGHQDIVIKSPTPNAEMVVKSYKGQEIYSGPVGSVSLQRDGQYTIVVTADGFKERKLTVSKSMTGWAFGNLIWILPIFWGVGIAVDAMSGGLWTLSPEEATIALREDAPVQKASPAPAPEAGEPPIPPPAAAAEQ